MSMILKKAGLLQEDPLLLAADRITVRGLPEGYGLQVYGDLHVAPPSGEVTTLEAAPEDYPFRFEVKNTYGEVVATVEESWGGDEWVYLTPVADFMYSRLAGALQARDAASGGPLEKMLAVLGLGLQEVKDLADHAVDLIDVDTCPAEHLPYLGGLLGFEFPYDLDEALQRNFVRSIVSMYRIKGTPTALKFVVNRLIAGKGFKLDITNEDIVAKTFDVALTADDSADASGSLQSKINYLVGLYSPAGMVPRLVVVYYATEEFNTGRMNDNTHTTIEHTRWSFNVAGHNFNTRKTGGSVVSFNTLGQQTLNI